ncbi:DUF4906 domain-containing protein [Parabacteroides sp.]
MKKRKHQVLFCHRIMTLSACLLAGILLSCSDDLEKGDDGGTGNEGTRKITLPINLSFTPITETKAVTRPVKPGSELEKAGFHYELEVVSSTTSDTLSATNTKAVPTQLKNVVALLFGEKTKNYKGKAVVSGIVTAGTDLLLDFTVNSETDDSYRLVIVANDNAGTSYQSSPSLASFTGNYSTFQDIQMTHSIAADEDVPYVGSITGVKMEGASSPLVVPLYWSLAKVTYKINTFSIDGLGVNSIQAGNIGRKYFGTQGEYNGSGSTATLPARANLFSAYGTTLVRSMYYGENIQMNSSITSATDRHQDNAGDATYLRVSSVVRSSINTSPAIGEEYINKGGIGLDYYIYFGDGSVSDLSIRRNTKYTITININGTYEGQRKQALTDKRIRVYSSETSAGLNIGRFGGRNSAEFTSTGAENTITGYYTKDLLLEPNTSRSTAIDSVRRQWAPAASSSALQPLSSKYWDPTYALTNIDKTAGYAYHYCDTLTLGGVAKGTWYLPTQTQLKAIGYVQKWIKNNGLYANYSGFSDYSYWSSTEYNADKAWEVAPMSISTTLDPKTSQRSIRCVRDL